MAIASYPTLIISPLIIFSCQRIRPFKYQITSARCFSIVRIVLRCTYPRRNKNRYFSQIICLYYLDKYPNNQGIHIWRHVSETPVLEPTNHIHHKQTKENLFHQLMCSEEPGFTQDCLLPLSKRKITHLYATSYRFKFSRHINKTSADSE